ncbi:hypothetical protein PG994_003510 [Apiospora phragmitis]|uniref:Uncharacterized protein n=1 Tax=Apiospora phragmitis TaxID=2905665 RepID=A0ABR1VYE3_9PEZI
MRSFSLSCILLSCATTGAMAAPSASSSSNVTVNTIGSNGTASNGAGSSPPADRWLRLETLASDAASTGPSVRVLEAGSPAFGLGGSYTISTDNMTIGLGTGNVKTNTKADLALTLGYDGTAEFKITYSGKLSCQEGTDSSGANVFTSTGA